jgi:hypothetical protein
MAAFGNLERGSTMTQLNVQGLDQLKGDLNGSVCLPGDTGYQEACAIWNGAIKRRPAVVARCTSAQDVAAALRYAKREKLELSVRGGGHNFAGFALCEGGMMIDLTPMRSVTIDAAARDSTAPLKSTAWPCRAGSSAIPASRASPWAEGSVG